MSKLMDITDNQYYNFICGMQSALRLKDKTQPNIDTNVILKPIGVGGFGKIGIAIAEVLYYGTNTKGVVPVYTHDVDIGYSAFSCNITWDSNRLRVTSLQEGEFGEIGTHIAYNINGGKCLVRGLLDAPQEFNKPIILFYLAVEVLDTNITKDNPILIELLSGNGADQNYTTLLKHVQNAQDSKYYMYYITPTKNVSGAIVSEKESTNTPIGEDKVIAATSSPSGIFIGSSFTPPGDSGVVPIVANSNIKDNFPYNGIHVKVVVEDSTVLFNYLSVSGIDGWTLTATKTINSNGYVELDITGKREELKMDSVTVGYISYEINNKETDYVIPLLNTLSQLTS